MNVYWLNIFCLLIIKSFYCFDPNSQKNKIDFEKLIFNNRFDKDTINNKCKQHLIKSRKLFKRDQV